ncbi:PXPV repeat-containing protein [Caballeronia sp. S22]
MKRGTLFLAVGISSVAASSAAFAHADIGVYLGVPGPVYVAPPPVVYEAPPPVFYPPTAVYGYRYDHGGDYRDERRWHDHGRHRGWEHHHRDEDD